MLDIRMAIVFSSILVWIPNNLTLYEQTIIPSHSDFIFPHQTSQSYSSWYCPCFAPEPRVSLWQLLALYIVSPCFILLLFTTQFSFLLSMVVATISSFKLRNKENVQYWMAVNTIKESLLSYKAVNIRVGSYTWKY